jgi:hypothetical protein
MRQSKKAPAAGHDHVGREAVDRQIIIRISVELLRGILRDVTELEKAGCLPEARRRYLAALVAHRMRAGYQSHSDGLALDAITVGISELMDIDRELGTFVALESIDTPLSVIARVLQACRVDWLGLPDARNGKFRQLSFLE